MSIPAAVNSQRRRCPGCGKKPGHQHRCKGCQKLFCPQCAKPDAHQCASIATEGMGSDTGSAHDTELETGAPRASAKPRATQAARAKWAGRKRQALAHCDDGSTWAHHSDASKQWPTAHTQELVATDSGEDYTWGTWGPCPTQVRAPKARP